MALLPELLDAAGVEPGVRDRLARYGRLVLETNRSLNLTGAKTEDDLAPHLLDSLSLLPYLGADLIDVGSGAGFPAIPLAIASGRPITMVETTQKKALFLRRALDELELEGEVVNERAEVAGHVGRLRDHFTTGTARAVGSGPTVMELLLPFVAAGGVALLQRGKLDETERAAMSDAAPVLAAEVEAELPAGGDRRIILVRKLGPTPQRFPRRAGVPDQRPLCLER
ncbi:MAG TPA: 16S rRNA (guanine(527)-N(7))-methyltransferase RsmG [Candidatus Tumulicola sp.]|jgi:16S rRNA (guanine527-N7)-methyltransferase